MDVRERVEELARALCEPGGPDLDAWFTPDARLSLPSVGLDRDLRAVLAQFPVLPLAACRVEVVRVVRNVVMADWDVTTQSGEGGGTGNAVLSIDRDGRVTHLRLEGALLASH